MNARCKLGWVLAGAMICDLGKKKTENYHLFGPPQWAIDGLLRTERKKSLSSPVTPFPQWPLTSVVTVLSKKNKGAKGVRV
jgi:hypothetical protein